MDNIQQKQSLTRHHLRADIVEAEKKSLKRRQKVNFSNSCDAVPPQV